MVVGITIITVVFVYNCFIWFHTQKMWCGSNSNEISFKKTHAQLLNALNSLHIHKVVSAVLDWYTLEIFIYSDADRKFLFPNFNKNFKFTHTPQSTCTCNILFVLENFMRVRIFWVCICFLVYFIYLLIFCAFFWNQFSSIIHSFCFHTPDVYECFTFSMYLHWIKMRYHFH